MDPYNFLMVVLIYAPSVIFAITLHEAAHGYVAKYFGDTTAYMLGRITLNPMKHIDPIGTVLVPLVTALAGFPFGWAKPVPVNFNNLRNPKRDMFWVAAAGPGSNIVQAFIWGLCTARRLRGRDRDPGRAAWDRCGSSAWLPTRTPCRRRG